MPTLNAPAGDGRRILSVDILRGLTIALMILVNDPGDWAHVYRQLDHSEWNGCTLTDLVFPTFLFVAGCSIVLSMASRVARGESRRTMALHVLRRSVSILLIGWLLALLPHFHFTRLRLFGVLPRTAACYLVAALLYLRFPRARTLALIAAGLLVGYWALMRFVSVSGFGVPTHEIPLLDPDRNLAAWVDRGFTAFTRLWFHTGRLYEKTRDPEGLLSTLPAIATSLLGVLAGLWLRSGRLARGKVGGLLLAGVACLGAGLVWSVWLPLNKKLWTSSYVLFAGGWALLALGLLYWLLDARGFQARSRVVAAAIWPWRVFGSNAIVAYVLSDVLVEVLLTLHHGTASWLGWVYRSGFARGVSTDATSVMFAVAFTVACFVPVWVLWRRGIFLKL